MGTPNRSNCNCSKLGHLIGAANQSNCICFS